VVIAIVVAAIVCSFHSESIEEHLS